MTSCRVAETTARLADLTERALNGEPVADLERLSAHRLKLAPGAEDAVTVVSRMRDEDQH